MNNYAPILLFVYNRPEHTKRCIKSLLQSPVAAESRLYIFSDGAKGAHDAEAVADVRQYIHAINGFKEVIVDENYQNFGLAETIIYGVTKVVNIYGRVIVVEDDLILAPGFLGYMNEALEMYKDTPEVVNINGHILSSPMKFPENFLISFADSWGWATWKRGWDIFEKDGAKLLREIEASGKSGRFDMGYHFTRMLREQISGKNNSWAIRWNASIFTKDKLSLNAGKPLAINSGFGKDATHCNTPDLFSVKLYTGEIHPKMITPAVENKTARLMLRITYMLRTSYTNKLRILLLARLKSGTK